MKVFSSIGGPPKHEVFTLEPEDRDRRPYVCCCGARFATRGGLAAHHRLEAFLANATRRIA